ncbi:tRNA pseudouridine(55) synthase TruB [Candidatus Omnitrophota bacterium]
MQKHNHLEGIIVIDKPSGMTSHDVVDVVRKKLGMRRIGHAGTLDPIATGVLILLVGKATKLFSCFEGFDKEYEATLTLGKTTDTGDIEGIVIKESPVDHISQQQVDQAFSQFVGSIEQVPPMVSALKHNGKRLYELARKGVDVPRKARAINIHSLKILKFDLPNIDFYAHCSKGTYIRKLGEDIGNTLEVGGHISRIRRTGIGQFTLNQAVQLDDVNEHSIRRWSDQ